MEKHVIRDDRRSGSEARETALAMTSKSTAQSVILHSSSLSSLSSSSPLDSSAEFSCLTGAK